MAQLNLDVQYDKTADVLYVTFGTNEPSYSQEVDDMLIIDRGFFSGFITGFRVLDVKLHNIKGIGFWTSLVSALITLEAKAMEEFSRRTTNNVELIQRVPEDLKDKLESILD